MATPHFSSTSISSAAAAASSSCNRKRPHAFIQPTLTRSIEVVTSATPATTTEDAIDLTEQEDEDNSNHAAAAAAAETPSKRMKRTTAPSSSLFTLGSAVAAASTTAIPQFWTYLPSVVASSARANFFSTLRGLVNPTPGRIFVYGRFHDERRLTAVFARKAGGFKYSGTEKAASGEWPDVIQQLHEIAVAATIKLQQNQATTVDAATSSSAAAAAASSAAAAVIPPVASSTSTSTAAPFWDTVLLNYYRDGSDSISWHSDKDALDSTIASFSFGATREFRIRQRPSPGSKKNTSTKTLKQWSIDLEDGSLVLMHPGMQARFHHSIPACKKISAGRINVTFRCHNRMQSTAGQEEVKPRTVTG